jgi:putative effector of murein hydrolase
VHSPEDNDPCVTVQSAFARLGDTGRTRGIAGGTTPLCALLPGCGLAFASAGPVGWSLLTIAVYFACRWLFVRFRWPLLYPGLTGIVGMVAILECTGRPYAQYEHSTAWINWLLGPAVVAMAVPIYQLRATVRANGLVLASVVPLGLAFAASSTPLLLLVSGRPREVVAAGALKSITSPVGYRLALDAHLSTDAVLAGILIAGMLGATLGPPLLGWMGVRDERAAGLALGCASHGIGVARALEISRRAGAFASLGMSGTAIVGALVLPYLLRWIAGTG